MDVFWWSVERAGGDTGMGDLVKKMEGASKPEEPELVVYRDSTASEAKMPQHPAPRWRPRQEPAATRKMGRYVNPAHRTSPSAVFDALARFTHSDGGDTPL